jgi:hypothetical protein
LALVRGAHSQHGALVEAPADDPEADGQRLIPHGKDIAGCPVRLNGAVGRFWAAGVPIVAGSDSGNWPIDPYHFHGPTTLREIELLGARVCPWRTRSPPRPAFPPECSTWTSRSERSRWASAPTSSSFETIH